MLFRQIRAIKNLSPIKIIFATISAVGGADYNNKCNTKKIDNM